MERTPGVASSGDDATARQAAADAAALAANARQMVLNRDPLIADLQATAAGAQQAVVASAQDRVLLHQRITDLAAATSPQAEQIATASSQAVSASASATAANAKADAVTSALAALPKPVTIATGQAKTASLLALGGSMDVTVTLSRTMTTNTYNVEVIPISSGLIAGNATIVVKAKTTTTVTLTVTSIVAVAASSVVSVIAWG